MQKITSGPFADPYRHLISYQKNNSHKNRNHILATVNNGGAASGNNKNNHNQSENNYNNHTSSLPSPQQHQSYNPRRPSLTAALQQAVIANSGPGDIDVVDNSNCLPPSRTLVTNVQDMHTPSESNSETLSSSEQSSSSGEEWESGELLSSEQKFDSTSDKSTTAAATTAIAVGCSGKKHHTNPNTVPATYDDDHNPYYSDDNYYYGSSLGNTRSLSQRKKFKATKVPTSTNPIMEQKMRWLANMRSDPDFAETLKSNVQFRSPNSNDSLNSDYYSSICDKQLSFGSPCKSPGELVRMASVAENVTDECSDIVVASKPPQVATGFAPKTAIEPCKSPSKTDIFKARFFSFARREITPSTPDKSETAGPIPLITVDSSHCDSKVVSPQLGTSPAGPRPNRCTPFSFREIRQEIQSVIRHSASGTTTKLKEKK